MDEAPVICHISMPVRPVDQRNKGVPQAVMLAEVLRDHGYWAYRARLSAASPSGAMLEVLVYLEIDPEECPATMQLLRIEMPESASQAQMPTLPVGWSADPELTRGIGNQFLDECSALLPVPSAIIPSTVNYLFNPRHPEAQSATIHIELFTPGSRLC